MNSLFRGLKLWILGEFEFYAKDCTVLSVDEENQTCTVQPTTEEAEISGISLGRNIVFVPVVGSVITVVFKAKTEAYISSAKDAEVLINGGENGGLININDLVTKINRLEDKLKDHEHVYNAYPSIPTLTTPALLFAPPDTTLVFTNTSKSEIEDETVKH